MRQPRYFRSSAEHGATRPIILGLLICLGLWGALTRTMAPTDTATMDNYRQIAEAYTTHAQAFYAAESGLAEARARLRLSAGGQRLIDTAMHDPTWGTMLTSQITAQEPTAALSGYPQVASVQSDLDYHVTIRHATTPGTATVLRWGDAHGMGLFNRNTTRGEPIYVLHAQGKYADSRHTIEAEVAPEPPPTVPAAVYVAGGMHAHTTRVAITGIDSCGTPSQAGIQTPLAMEGLSWPAGVALHGTPPVATHAQPLQIPLMVHTLRAHATSVYTSDVVHAAGAPAPHWGTPTVGATPHAPSTCQAQHIVYYDTHGARGHLASGTTGCGILLVDGDLEINGTFTWYGAILVNGGLRLSGDGVQHITGGVVVAGTVTATAGTDLQILYCSEAIAQPVRSLPLRILAWRDRFPNAP